ncbi:methylaspartate mutase [Streptomyces sp. NPDC005925]|jgi:methylaspartate mutase sigma subunit|uniref:cobalamin B12-binding domain-containing protein n=1 Tax=Streptomyces sp. NPDC005925 TaxID=3157172 RepID=UPI0033CEFA4F
MEVAAGSASSATPFRGTVVVSGLASDAHTWNLVYLQLLIEELGYHVVNLGPCVPDAVLVETCRRIDPALIVLGSVNGHGRTDGLRVVARLRDCPELVATPTVIGGKLTVSDEDASLFAPELLEAGFDAVFPDRAAHPVEFTAFVAALPAAPRRGLSIGGPE